MPSINKQPLFSNVINVLLSVLATVVGSLKDFPLGVIAGMTSEFIFISIIGALAGTILALKNFRKSWVLALITSVIAVPAVFYYSYLTSRSGLSYSKTVIAMFVYFYIFFAASFLLTCFEMLIRPPSDIIAPDAMNNDKLLMEPTETEPLHGENGKRVDVKVKK